MKKPRKCIDCHFLCITDNNALTGGNLTKDTVSEERREKYRNDDFSNFFPGETLECFKGVWAQGTRDVNKANLDYVVNVVDRKNFCFYFKYTKGIQFKGAEIALNQEKENFALKKTQIALYIAVGSLVVSILFNILILVSKT